MEYKLTNREKNLDPKRTGKFWCHRCDGCLIGSLDKKCINCGCIFNKKNSGLKVRYKRIIFKK